MKEVTEQDKEEAQKLKSEANKAFISEFIELIYLIALHCGPNSNCFHILIFLDVR